jgi:predicted MPP superfamily phosphohydrolase
MLQLSDLHFGPQVDTNYLLSAVAKANSLEPDMVVLTGDYMTAAGTELIDPATQVLGRLKAPQLGIYAILGNHDYGRHWSDPNVADKLVTRLTELGITTLRNERRVVGGLQLVGLDDLWGPNFDAEKAFAQVDWSGPTLTLCHNPDAVDRADFRSCRGWILAGHTHGGQCKPPFLAPPLLPVTNKRYTSGEFEVGQGRRLYINRGVGHLTRVRFNVRPEMTVFRLTSV